jgi:iron(III) transport system substrate-binding protein
MTRADHGFQRALRAALPAGWRLRRPPAALSAGVVLLAGLLLLAGCSSNQRDALVIFSGRGEDLVRPLLEQFAKEKGIDIDVRYDDSANLALKIDQEGDRTKADVFLSQSPGTVGYLAYKDRLGALDPAVIGRIDARFRSPKNLWAGVSARQRVLVYNEDLVPVQDLPQSVFDLTDPRYAGKVRIAPTNASFEDFVTSMRELVGDDRTLAWMTAMDRLGSPTYPDNNAIVAAVGRGEIPLGLVNHYYNHRALEEDPKLPSRNHTFRPGDPGSLILITTVTVLKTSKHKDDAAAFVDFLLSEKAQRYFTDHDFEYPLLGGVAPRRGLPPLELSDSPPINLDSLGDKLKGTLDLIDRSGLGR